MRLKITALMLTSALFLCRCGPSQDDASLGTSNEALTADPAPFKVMTYNVRLLTAEDTGLYSWTRRGASLTRLVQTHSPDILGVQELTAPGEADDLNTALSATHDHFQSPNGQPKNIYFRKSRFKLSTAVPNTAYVKVLNPYGESDSCYPNAANRSFNWVKLDDRLTGDKLLVINSHPAHAAACFEGRQENAKAIRDVISHHASGRTVIVMGDFNSDFTHPDYANDTSLDLLTRGGTPSLHSAWPDTVRTTTETMTYNPAWKAPSNGRIRFDYIFVSGSSWTTAAPLIDRSVNSDGVTPSDHFPLITTVRRSLLKGTSVADERGDGSSMGTRFEFADVTGDGCADKMSWNPTLNAGVTQVFPANCEGTFGAGIADSSGPHSVSSSTRFTYADVDGDKCADKISWNPTWRSEGVYGVPRVQLANCNGTFGPLIWNDDGGNSATSATRFHYVDVNGDRCADKIMWTPTIDSGRVRVYLSTCSGRFRPAISNTDASASTLSSTQYFFADFTGDGAADKLVWNPTVDGGKTRLFRSNRDGTFTSVGTHEAEKSTATNARYAYADVNGDGKADKLCWRPDYWMGRTLVYLSTGSNFDSKLIIDNAGYSQSEGTTFFFADVNGNGALDKIYYNRGVASGATRTFLANE